MAHKIVKDSHLSIHVKQVPVAGTVKSNDWVSVGAKRGLAGFDARESNDRPGEFYVTVDTAAHIRLEGVAAAFADGAPVYMTPGGTPTATATGNTLIGYADRAKGAVSGDLHVQLVPGA